MGRRASKAGMSPGSVVFTGVQKVDAVAADLIQYDSDHLSERFELTPAEALAGREPERTVWINVIGLHDTEAIEAIGADYGLHPLVLEDLVAPGQRPKLESYDGYLFLVLRMLSLDERGELVNEQLGLVLGKDFVLTFQERPGDVFDPVRDRLRSSSTRIRRMGPDYLAYALLDAVVDGYFPVIEALGGVVDALEEEIVGHANRATLARIHALRRTLLTLHRVQWRQRDAVATLLRDDALPMSDAVKPYLRDVHDHAFQTLDALETYRDLVVSLMDLHLSTVSNRTNEVMKTLTIVATVFIPLTFLTGVYGMNFEYMPELQKRWAYPLLWGLMVFIGVGLVAWFRRRGWMDASDAPPP